VRRFIKSKLRQPFRLMAFASFSVCSDRIIHGLQKLLVLVKKIVLNFPRASINFNVSPLLIWFYLCNVKNTSLHQKKSVVFSGVNAFVLIVCGNQMLIVFSG
jgi:hypothetical protein